MSLNKNGFVFSILCRTAACRARVAALAAVMGGAVVCAPGSALAARPADAQVYIANDQASEVKDLLAQGWNPNTVVRGQPAIMQAVRDNAWAVFDVLAADRRTNVNVANPSDETPLMYLAVQGQTARAKSLIARGAQVNRLGWTPLHYAASKAHLDTAKLLLADQAIVNAPGPDGTTPLMMAGYSGSQPMVQLLLDSGADPTMRNLQGLDAAAWARSAKYDDLAKSLDVASANHARTLGAGGGKTGPAAAGAPASRGPVAAPVAPPSGASAPAANGQPPSESVQGVNGLRLDR